MRELLLYVAAGVAYICLGLYNQNYLYSVFEGAAFLWLFMVGLPRLFNRLFR